MPGQGRHSGRPDRRASTPRHRGRGRDRGAPRQPRSRSWASGAATRSVWSMAPRVRRAIRSSRSTPGLGTTRCTTCGPDGTGSVELGRRCGHLCGQRLPGDACTDRCPGPSRRDTDIDVFQTGGGVDVITSGRGPGSRTTTASRRAPAATASGTAVPRPGPCSTTVRPQTPLYLGRAMDGRARRRQQSLAVPASADQHGALLDRPSTGSRCALLPAATSSFHRLRRGRGPQLSTAPSATWPRPQRSPRVAATTASASRTTCPAASTSVRATTP